jgi:ATP-binding cassette subfamily F protein 1
LQVNKAFEKYEKQMKAAKQSGKNSKTNQEKVLKQAERTQAKRGKGKNEPIDDAGAAQSNVPQKWSDYSVQFHFPEPTELAPPLMQLIDADFKYPGRDDFGLKNVNIGIDMGSRIAIAGPNGAGKTTLMNLLSGKESSSVMQWDVVRCGAVQRSAAQSARNVTQPRSTVHCQDCKLARSRGVS